MKSRIIALAAAATLLASASANAAVNLLVNPGFEDVSAVGPDISTTVPGTGWSGWNNWTAPNNGGFITDAIAHSGTQSGKTYSGPNCGLFQFVSVTPGLTYEASAYFYKMSTDAIQGNTTLDVRLTFRDAGGANIGGPVVSTQLVASSMAADTWIPVSIQAIAPANAASVQFLAFMNNPTYAGGAMFIDDTSLTAVPEPAALSLLGLGALGLMRHRRKA